MGIESMPASGCGLSATRTNIQTFPLNRKMPGFNRHAISIPGTEGTRSAGLRIGFCEFLFAMSAIDSVSKDRLPVNLAYAFQTKNRKILLSDSLSRPRNLKQPAQVRTDLPF